MMVILRLFQKTDVPEQFIVIERLAPLAFPVTIGHAAKAEALDHEEFDDKGGKLDRSLVVGRQLTVR
jgi:hypothetical protein